MNEIAERLEDLERLGLTRRLRMISGPQGPTVLLDGRPVLLLCSNNYLGLADHPRVREAAAEAARRWGVGAGASRLVSGTMTIHRRLEERLADFEGTESCLLFGSGYLANLGVIGALAGEIEGSWALRWRLELFYLLVKIQSRWRIAPRISFRPIVIVTKNPPACASRG